MSKTERKSSNLFETFHQQLKRSATFVSELVRHNEIVQASIVLFVLILLFFSPILSQGKLPLNADFLTRWQPWNITATESSEFNHVLSDQVDHVIPSQEFLRNSTISGDYPLWNPNINTGTPSGSLLITDAFTLSALTKLFLGSMWGHFAYMILKLYLAGLFLFMFLRLIGLKFISALLGSIVFIFSSFSIVNAAIHVSEAYIFVPAILYFGEKFIGKPHLKYYLLLCFLVTFLIISGFPSVIFYFLIILALYFLFRVLILQTKDQFSRRVSTVLIIGSSFIFGILLSSFTLLPTFELLKSYSLDYRSGHAMWHITIEQTNTTYVCSLYNGFYFFLVFYLPIASLHFAP